MHTRTLALAFASVTTFALVPSAFAQDEAPPIVVRPYAHVHVEHASARVVLEARMSDAEDWTQVCYGSCDRDLDLDATYRVNGSNVRASKPFRLDAKPGESISLDVDVGSSAAYAAGIALTSVGSVFLAGGTGLVIAGAVAGGWGLLFALMFGGGAAAVGLATFVPGIILLTNSGTSVRHDDDNAFVRPRDEARKHEVLPIPQTFGVPIFSTTF